MNPHTTAPAVALARLRQWLVREPLVHFLGLGALIFVAFGMWGGTTLDRRIEVTALDMARLRDISIKQWGKEPDAQTLQDLVQSFVREEVLYREALASGLDRDDVIVRRRLAQKMEFLSNEMVRTPSDADLHSYFVRHSAQYQQAARVDFEQVYFSPGARGKAAVADALGAVRHLREGQVARGDPFTLPTTAVLQDEAQLQRAYGASFAQTLLQLPVGAWSGPVESAMGLHLVRVKQHLAAHRERFEDVRERVAAEFTNTAVQEAREQAYARLLSRYTVVTPVSEIRVSQL
jgi:peptidyl-prolyl cis-trans isomerase C